MELEVPHGAGCHSCHSLNVPTLLCRAWLRGWVAQFAQGGKRILEFSCVLFNKSFLSSSKHLHELHA